MIKVNLFLVIKKRKNYNEKKKLKTIKSKTYNLCEVIRSSIIMESDHWEEMRINKKMNE